MWDWTGCILTLQMFYTSCSHTAKKYFSVITNKLWTLILQAWVIPQPPQCSPDDRKQNTVNSVKETLIWHNCLSDMQMMMLCSLQLLQLKSTTTTNTPIIIIINFTSSNKTVRRNNKWSKNFYHAMLCIHGTSHGPVSMSVCHKSKRLNESSWFLACELPSTRPTLC